MGRSYVSTLAADGNPLTIYYIHDAPEDEVILKAEILVLQDFAAAWNRGKLDVNGKTPLADTQPCHVIVVTGSRHNSTNTPTEAKHLTVSPASEASWAAGYARSVVHVYSINDNVALGYSGWRKTTHAKDRFQGAAIKRHLEEAMRHDLGDKDQAPAGYYEDGTPYYWSEKHQKFYYYGADGQRHHARDVEGN